MILTQIILGISCVVTFLIPDTVSKFTNYENKTILINIWNIYSFTLLLILLTQNKELAIICCTILSMYYHIFLLINNKINVEFVKLSILLNSLILLEQIKNISNNKYILL